MGKVRLEIPLWVCSVWNVKTPIRIILEKEMNQKATISDLLSELVSHHDALFGVVFDSGTGKVNSHVLVFLNDRLLEVSDVARCELKDGDSVMLLPICAGG